MDGHQVMPSMEFSLAIKRKRTKRHRPPSPTCSEPPQTVDNSMSSSTTSIEFSPTTASEEQDMAHCLILLAQGSLHCQTPKLSQTAAAANKASGSSQLYQCKTCNRFFPSFQALGGHRASHKKSHDEEKKATEKQNDDDDQLLKNMSTALSLQMPNRSALHGSCNIRSNKVHECSICGVDFSSGQALGGHMRRHRSAFATTSNTTTTTRMNISLVTSSSESQESKKPRNSLELDLNLPAPEDDLQDSNFHFASKKQVLVFSASSLVDCHY